MPYRLTCRAFGLVLLGLTLLGADDKTTVPAALFTYPRGGPERTGAFPAAKLPERPVTSWIDNLEVDPGAPVIAGDRLIVGTRRGHLVALSLKDGELLWNVVEPGRDLYVAPVVVGDRIYCASNHGISAHAMKDGSVLWQTNIQGGAGESSPLLVGERAIVGGYDGFVHAVDTGSGKELWKTDIVKGAPADPKGYDGAKARIGDHRARPYSAASDGKTVFIPIFDQSRVVALDLKTGEFRWSFQSKGWMGGMPTVGEGKVFVGSQDGKIYALDPGTGKVLWEFKTKSRGDSDLGYCEGSVFGATSDGRCYRIDAANGKKIWEYETEVGPDKKHYFLSGAPLIDATAVYFGSWDGHLYAINRKDGTLKWKHKPHDQGEHVTALITDGSRIYVALDPTFDYEKQMKNEGVQGIAAIGPAP